MGMVFSIVVTAIASLFIPATVDASCPGLQGDALEKCLKDNTDTGPRKVTFYGPDGKGHELDTAAVTESIENVCKAVNEDGVFVAYRSANDLEAGRKWKELACTKGTLAGLWKEYFSDEEMTTILFYDPSGRAVKQAVYMDGRLLKEQALSGAPAPRR